LFLVRKDGRKTVLAGNIAKTLKQEGKSIDTKL
jgi:hypothetical protein